MKTWTWAILPILMLTCCESKREKPKVREYKHNTKLATHWLDNSQVPVELLNLDMNSDKAEFNFYMEDNLFGRFFCDRAELYIIDNPLNEIHAVRPASIILYFLDHKLRQTQYHLKHDISRALLRQHGRFSITGLDPKNKGIIDHERWVLETSEGLQLNPALDNVELKWTFRTKEIRYRITNTPGSRYMYAEKTRNFEKEFKALERRCS